MSAGRVIGGVGKAILSGAHKAQSLHTQAAMVTAQHVAAPVRRATTSVAKKALLKKTDKSLANGYTGYQASRLTNHVTGWGTLGVAAAVGAASGAFGKDVKISGLDHIQTRASKVGEVSYGGAPSVMSADGVGTATQAPTLGASGDLVFGLHNGRKG